MPKNLRTILYVCTCILDSTIPKSLEKPLKLGENNRKGNLDKHVQLVNKQLNYFHANEASKFKLFALTLIGLARLWFNALPDESIESWTNFCERFTTDFTSLKWQPEIVVALSEIN